ncbi:GAF domain-containing protein [Chitinophaga lutea]|uniref:GAF domain-containing protein n=1 Tax=Chitinophaga lutea TaxID=2488634 RepID=A0A3N4PXV3_9BACT|nr:GAF domain-containing protein [Chitinophaga lutea]RPE09971.1 GAF domain-containing protein [Chitinophaga lutea]
MKKLQLDVTEGMPDTFPIDSTLSFAPFVTYLKARVAEEKDAIKQTLYQQVLERFEAQPPEEEMARMVHTCLSPSLLAKNESIWGICPPLRPVITFATDGLLLLVKNWKDELFSRRPEDFRKERLQQIYAFILRRLYNFQPPVRSVKYHAYSNPETGLMQYYTVNVNPDFIDVEPIGELPAVDFSSLHSRLNNGEGYEILENVIPLRMFRFKGISILTVTDVTALQAVENIRKIRLSRTPGDNTATYRHVIQSLKTLVGNPNVEFDLFTFVRVNGKLVYGYEKGGTGILYKVWGEEALTPEQFQAQAEGYARRPNSFFSRNLAKEDLVQNAWLKKFIDHGVGSLSLSPVFYDHTLVGVLCMHTWGKERFDERLLALIEPAIGAIAQLLQIYVDEFNMEIDTIIKEKFTSIQPAVQWKFNEAAWQYLLRRKKNEPMPEADPIIFNAVYPLYGAVDIRNSTTERNLAIKADMEQQLQLLSNTLAAIGLQHHSSLLDGMQFACRNWQQSLQQEALGTMDESNINHFLQQEALPFLQHMVTQHPDVQPHFDAYLAGDTAVDTHKSALELSMQMLNNRINSYLEKEKEQLQLSYPCYFEKFRTDGIEYDIYIGQSIVPDQPFSPFHLKNVRLWQLSSMAEIARLTNSLLPQMPKALHTTQLIFVHNQTIDISFRPDERKFDVEGAYNIRYQMIKKRIDKVHIRGTEERLTQPGTIALIYFNRKEIEDYIPFIQYLQEKNVLQNELEDLLLEDLQGLSGLKALRVKVVL